MSDEKLQQLRDQIDQIDDQLLDLFNRRAACAVAVAEVKRNAIEGPGDAINFFRPDREAQVIQRFKSRNPGPLSDDEVGRLVREVMSACLALEQPLKIAYLGPEGTFTQSAALKHFGHSVSTVPMSSIPDVFSSVESGHADYGLVPVENSTEGVISHTLDMFIDSDLKVCGEVEIRIHHHLVNQSQDVSKIKHIYSHQQSFAQCRHWLDQNFRSIERIPVSSNAEAARIASQDQSAAAICGLPAVEIFDLQICFESIEDLSDNTTRFVIIGNQDVAPSGDDKTSLLISTKNYPGALLGLLQPLADNNISMNKIESRPAPDRKWEYIFFIDIDGHQQSANVRQALDELKQQASLFKVLGSYPKASL
ncbi:MAG: prephenate dehydratase [Gammaproteobacteria bacterium]|nr:prephenate dehydratase [Gammaproteobacteria bacterium]MCZ6724084.1 prephenate dehydratase [Gammaproteobacteria bacterium]MCZ6881959.1 prephenate dehydratase [Gammaproteobacteria bacterium]